METQELLEKLLENSKKELFFSKVRTALCGVIAIVFVVCAILIVPQALALTNQAGTLMTQAAEIMENANQALEGINQMSGTIATLGDNMDTLVNENAQSLTSAMQKLNSIDFEGLNKAITDLGNVVEPLSRFFSFGKK